MGDLSIQPEAQSGRLAAVAARPLAELLECPPEAGSLLAGASGCIEFDAGEVVFRQYDSCKGLYVVVSGDFARKAQRFQMRVTLGSARPGDLVELAAALGDGHHTYTLTQPAVPKPENHAISSLLYHCTAQRHIFQDH
jgi:hypothetical protein